MLLLGSLSAAPSILVAFGTRPEAIKLAPVVEELCRASIDVKVCVTGQHREMLAQVLQLFDITPDVDLDVMTHDQGLGEITAAVLRGVTGVLRELRPSLVIVQGDTASALAAGLAAYYAGIDVAHVEAGLRSGNLNAPWPEEANRRLLSVVARLHFAPTDEARANLLREGVDAARIHVTGNTVVDALQKTLARIGDDVETSDRRLVLVTGHRRESFGSALESICHALADLAREHEDLEIVYPVHLNPNVREPVHRILGGRERIRLIEPVDYVSLVKLMKRSHCILTDSGGIQEEAPTLGKPVLVLRDTTERPEAVRAGNARLVGTDRATIVAETTRLLRDREHYDSMSRPANVFGDGRAALRIAGIVRGALR
jgi:UDP-N-acetylglucosamine 2-epimerase (non-hydrolysing)